MDRQQRSISIQQAANTLKKRNFFPQNILTIKKFVYTIFVNKENCLLPCNLPKGLEIIIYTS